MVDAAGRSVAAPLRKGSSFCLFHAVPFSTKPVRPTGPIVVIYLDLETTGVDVSRDRIVEIAALTGGAPIPGPSPFKPNGLEINPDPFQPNGLEIKGSCDRSNK